MGTAAENEKRISTVPTVPLSAGWIDVPVCETILTKDIKLIAAVDGSDNSMTAFAYVLDGLLQDDRTAFVEVLHVYDDDKTYLPVSCQKEALRSTCEARLTSSVSSRRYRMTWVSKGQEPQKRPVGEILCQAIAELPAEYVCMGFYGLKGKKECHSIMGSALSSNVFHVLNQGNSCSLICIKDESPKELPLRGRPGIFVVSVSLNKSSTKAFLDALRLSRPGDEIHVVYIKSYMEREESDYTVEVRTKYEAFFNGLQDGKSEAFSLFHDRKTKFVLEAKQRRETTPQAVVRYADSVNADFVVVGANAADRVSRGKKPVGSVSLQICLLTDRNFVVANWLDVAPRVYEASIRRAQTPV